MNHTKNRIGATNTAHNGMLMTIIDYKSSTDITIQFEDNAVVYHKTYAHFLQGKIAHPKQKNHRFIDRTGETNIASNGLKITIVTYRDSKNVDIQFEDGTLIPHQEYKAFKQGYIKHPHYNSKPNTTPRYMHIGETKRMNCGQNCTIIATPSAHELIVKFDTGEIRKTNYNLFKNGLIANHPNHIGEHYTMKCGLSCIITDYRNSHDVDVKFENGMIRTNTHYEYIYRQKLAPPKCINNIIINTLAYIYNNNWYYECSHPDWTEPRILSVQEMYDYKENTNESSI